MNGHLWPRTSNLIVGANSDPPGERFAELWPRIWPFKPIVTRFLKFIDELPNKNSPFSVTERFPENKIYVDLNHYHNVNNSRLMTIAACTFKGLQNVKTLNHQNGHRRNSAPTPLMEDRIYYKQVNDAIVSYSHAVHNLFAPHSNCINDQHIFGIYTRASFEKQCSLVWI